MPTYDYQCRTCGHAFEELQSILAEPLTMCPQCGNATLKRLMTGGAGLVFKGTGFYGTDYKPKAKDPSAPPAKKAETDAGSKKESKSDAKDSGTGGEKKESTTGAKPAGSGGEKKD